MMDAAVVIIMVNGCDTGSQWILEEVEGSEAGGISVFMLLLLQLQKK